MFSRTIRCAAVLTALALFVLPVAAFAAVAEPDVMPADVIQKPVALPHPDVAPSLWLDTGAGSMPAMIGPNVGTNKVTFGSFRDGDICVVQDPAGLTGHAGLFDSRVYFSLYSYALWSANLAPANGVQREQCIKYRNNDEAWGLRVSGGAAYRVAARNWAAKQVGKPYRLAPRKTDTSSFYCSKLAWCAWYYTMGVDLDADQGYWVWPSDLVNSKRTICFGYWT